MPLSALHFIIHTVICTGLASLVLIGCAQTLPDRSPPVPDARTMIAAAFPQDTVHGVSALPTGWPCSALHRDEPRLGGYRFTAVKADASERDMLACVLDRGNGKRGWQYYPADIEEKLFSDLHDDTRRYVEEHRDRAKAGFYPDGSALGPTCLVLTVEACLVEYFFAELGIAEELNATAFDPDRHLLIDVRGETERFEAPLPANLDHRVVQYGFDTHDPLALDELDRAAFAEAVTDARGDDPRPVALLCSVGVRSRAAVAALHEAGVRDAVSIRGGLSADPFPISPAS